MKQLLAAAAFAAGLLGLSASALASEADTYWQCVATAAGTVASWCPTSTTDPLPVTGTISSGHVITDVGSVTQANIAAGGVVSGAFLLGALADGAIATLGLQADAKSTATDTTPVSVMSVLKEISALEQAPASRAVTNAGTFAVQIVPGGAAGEGIAPVVSAAVETGHVIKGSAGVLYGFSVTSGAAAGYFEVFNSTTVPTAGAVTPVDCGAIPANSTVGVNYDPPMTLSTGISIAFSISTTCFTKTDSATAFISAQAK